MNVCVFCGSRPGNDPAFSTLASVLGRALGEGGHRLVYGGASVGLMGTLANACLDAGGEVIGIIPRSLVQREPSACETTRSHATHGMFQEYPPAVQNQTGATA